MIPTFRADLSPQLPPGHRYWTPRPSDIGEEGFGYFRGTWPMGRWPVSDARSLIRTERQLVDVANEVSKDVETYERVASALEHNDSEELPDELRHGSAWEILQEHIYDDEPLLAGLELGVAGLVVALASIGGCFPAASCRAHACRSWAPHPVVIAAVDQFRATRLADLVERNGCGFGIDDARPELLTIGAASVLPLMSLASEIVTNSAVFRKPRVSQGRRDQKRDGGVQETLNLDWS